MLNMIRTRLSFHLQAALTSVKALCSKPIATMMTVLVVAITLALPALFWVFSDNMQRITVGWQRSGHVSLYLKTPLSSANEADLLLRVRETPGVGQATLISSAQGLLELQQQEGMRDIMRYLPENPLPAVIEVTPAAEMNTPAQIERLYEKLKAYPHVEQAKFDIQWLHRLHAILDFAATLAHGLMVLLASAVVLIIGNTLRLAIHHRYEEIQVLKLVGATDAFILRPFLYSGVWYGLMGAVLAIFLMNVLLLSLTWVVNQLAAVYQMHYSLAGLSFYQVALLISTAIVLGWLGAFLSVKRHLASIEPHI